MSQSVYDEVAVLFDENIRKTLQQDNQIHLAACPLRNSAKRAERSVSDNLNLAKQELDQICADVKVDLALVLREKIVDNLLQNLDYHPVRVAGFELPNRNFSELLELLLVGS